METLISVASNQEIHHLRLTSHKTYFTKKRKIRLNKRRSNTSISAENLNPFCNQLKSTLDFFLESLRGKPIKVSLTY